MGQLRKQTIQSSFLAYVGFLIGAINTYFFTKQGLFTPEQYGLTQTLISIAQMIAPLGTLGVTSFMGRFYPYYFDHLKKGENDMLTVAVLFSGIGAVLVLTGCFLFEPFIVKQFSARSAMVVKFYYWSLVFAFSFLCYLVLEIYFGTLRKTVVPSFMKETVYRVFVSVLIILYAFGIINFDLFVILFCCIYLLIVILMVLYLAITKQLYFALKFSPVTRRIKKPAAIYAAFVYTGFAVNGIARQIDTLTVAGVKSLSETGIYTLNQFAAAVIQVPFRALQAIAGPLIAQNWKEKNMAEIDRIYKRASINLLLLSSFIFFMIWMNYDDGLILLNLDSKYASGKTVFLILGIYNIIDLTLGISGPLIATSPAWRFEFYAGLILLAVSIPLNIILIKWKGMEGAAIAALITFTIYNSARVIFIKRSFNILPFTRKTAEVLVMLAVVYGITWALFHNMHGLAGILSRSLVFTVLFTGSIFYFRLTPDLSQVLELVQKKWKK